MVLPGVPPWSAVLPVGAVTTDKLADNSITSAKIMDGGILGIDLGDGIILPIKLDPAFYGGNGVATTVSRSDHSHTKADVGLGNVDNTSDVNKPVSTAQAAAIATHAALATGVHGIGAGAVVGTTLVQTLTNKTLTAPAISSPTGLVKADVGLANVDNTSDVNKPVSTAVSTALSGKANTSHTHSGADITTGTVPIARLPTGATSTTLAVGNRGLPTGGSTGATLKKNSATDYDVTWSGVRTAIINQATSSSTTAQNSGDVDYVTTSLVLPNDGSYLVFVFCMYSMEGTTTAAGGDFSLRPTIGASVMAYPTVRGEQGVDSGNSAMHSLVVAGNQTVTCKLTVRWVAGNIGPKGGAILAVAIPI